MTKHQIPKFVFAMIVVVASVVRAEAPTSQPAAANKFLRFVRDDHGGATLQASVVRYENDAHVSVDLVAAIHIADPGFYRGLDASFDEYDAVLFERVQPKDATKPPKKTFGMWMAGFSQFLMSDAMGLEHQLHGVRYKDRANFIHADMDLETFQKMQEARGESMLGGASRAAGGMSREARQAREKVGRDILMAMISPDRPARLKMAIGEMFGQLGDAAVEGQPGGEPTVIIDERNRVALGVLKDVLTNKPEKKTIAIFYGAGHLKGMEKIITSEMGFHQVGPPMWRTAWDIRPMKQRPATQPATQPSN